MLAGAAAATLTAGLAPKRASAAPRVAARTFDENLPASTDVVVIGAGIVGVSSALQLALSGVSVVVCEKGFVGAEQSSRALGWVRVTGRDPRDIPLNLESRRVWAGLATSGATTGYRTAGLLYVASNAAELAARAGTRRRRRLKNLERGADEGAHSGNRGFDRRRVIHRGRRLCRADTGNRSDRTSSPRWRRPDPDAVCGARI